MKRVVVTGMGCISPIGNNIDEFWASARSGKSGAGPITRFDTTDFKTTYACEVKDFDLRRRIEKSEARKMDRFAQYSLYAAREAWEHAGLDADPPAGYRVGVVMGNGTGGFETIEDSIRTLAQRGPSRVPPMTIPKLISNIGPAHIAIALGAHGPVYSIATACASATDAIGNAMRHIRDGMCDVVVTGGAEASVTPLGVSGFNVIHALSSSYGDEPTKASRPFEKDRDGFVLGEGCGVLILESLEHAEARGATVLAEVAGNGFTNDANHLTAPHPEGEGAAAAMRMALDDAGIEPDRIGYINAHGTSTPINDPTETLAIKKVFGESTPVPVSSTKSMTGHCIGAAGAIEAIACIQALRESFLPPTINFDAPGEGCDLDYIPNTGRAAEIEYAMSNSLGFGGHNGVLVLKRV